MIGVTLVSRSEKAVTMSGRLSVTAVTISVMAGVYGATAVTMSVMAVEIVSTMPLKLSMMPGSWAVVSVTIAVMSGM